MVSKHLLPPLAILTAVVDAFTAPAPRFGVATKRFTVAPLQAAGSRADLSRKEFQLEELEDKEECETELWLNDDGTVTLGATNGPPVKAYQGDWHLLETASEGDQPFRMRLTRQYEAGSSANPDLDDLTYEVKREFWGNLEMVGDSISVTGKTHGTPFESGNAYIDEQSLLESELGYFTMIDAVASEGVEGEKAATAEASFEPNRFGTAEHPTSVSSLHALRSDLSQKEFQLEELEDKEECETEVWLNEDGTITLGATNGPPVKAYQGDWHLIETASDSDQPFRMRLTREYEAGSSLGGDLTYKVKREFWGNIEMVGGSLSVTGKTHGNPNPDSGNVYIDDQAVLDNELGYFTMIDAVASEGVKGERGDQLSM